VLNSIGLSAKIRNIVFNYKDVILDDGRSIDTDDVDFYWYFVRKTSTEVSILSEIDNYALTIQSGYLYVENYNDTVSFNWNIEKYEFEDDFIRRYAISKTVFPDHSDSIFTYSISSSLLNSALFQTYSITVDDVKSAVEKWNGISNNVNLVYIYSQVNSMIKVSKAPSFMYNDEYLLGGTFGSNSINPGSQQQLEELNHQDDFNYAFCYIYVDTFVDLIEYNILDNYDDFIPVSHNILASYFNHRCILCDDELMKSLILTVITHEIGHALKLTHCDLLAYPGTNYYPYRVLFPCIMREHNHGMDANTTSIASMIFYGPDNEYYVNMNALDITAFDKEFLRYKYSIT